LLIKLLWSPYGIGQTIVFMVALCNRADHYIFMLWFLSSSSSFVPRLISSVTDWMPPILPHMVWPWCEFKMQVSRLAGNTGRKKVAKNRHLGTIAQICRAISSQLKHVSTFTKSIKQQYTLQMSS